MIDTYKYHPKFKCSTKLMLYVHPYTLKHTFLNYFVACKLANNIERISAFNIISINHNNFNNIKKQYLAAGLKSCEVFVSRKPFLTDIWKWNINFVQIFLLRIQILFFYWTKMMFTPRLLRSLGMSTVKIVLR